MERESRVLPNSGSCPIWARLEAPPQRRNRATTPLPTPQPPTGPPTPRQGALEDALEDAASSTTPLPSSRRRTAAPWRIEERRGLEEEDEDLPRASRRWEVSTDDFEDAEAVAAVDVVVVAEDEDAVDVVVVGAVDAASESSSWRRGGRLWSAMFSAAEFSIDHRLFSFSLWTEIDCTGMIGCKWE